MLIKKMIIKYGNDRGKKIRGNSNRIEKIWKKKIY